MILVVTAEAEADLESIGDHIAQRNPGRAVSFIRELRDVCGSILAAPNGYPLVRKYEGSGIRRRPHGNYLIFYRATDAAVEIIAILHGARDYEPLLFPEA
ncbi:MAG: type II toxin-antitoxin system RelE/ParE family toxin [Hyphomicrobiales bacterium]